MTSSAHMLARHGIVDVMTHQNPPTVPRAISATFGGHGVAAAMAAEAHLDHGGGGTCQPIRADGDADAASGAKKSHKRETAEGRFMRRGSLSGGGVGIQMTAPPGASGGGGVEGSDRAGGDEGSIRRPAARRSSVARVDTRGFKSADHRTSGAIKGIEGFGEGWSATATLSPRRSSSAPPARPSSKMESIAAGKGGWVKRPSAQRFSDFGASMLRLGSEAPFEGAKEALQLRIEREERASMPGGCHELRPADQRHGDHQQPLAAPGDPDDQSATKRTLRRMSMPGGRVLEGGKGLGIANDLNLRHSSDSSAMKGVLCNAIAK